MGVKGEVQAGVQQVASLQYCQAGAGGTRPCAPSTARWCATALVRPNRNSGEPQPPTARHDGRACSAMLPADKESALSRAGCPRPHRSEYISR